MGGELSMQIAHINIIANEFKLEIGVMVKR
jgi:hypothetical protein